METMRHEAISLREQMVVSSSQQRMDHLREALGLLWSDSGSGTCVMRSGDESHSDTGLEATVAVLQSELKQEREFSSELGLELADARRQLTNQHQSLVQSETHRMDAQNQLSRMLAARVKADGNHAAVTDSLNQASLASTSLQDENRALREAVVRLRMVS